MTQWRASLGELKLDGLVNNAGVTHLAPLLDTTLDDFDRVMSVNVRAAFHVSKLVAPRMPRGSAIVNVSSQASSRAFADHTAYCVSKGALDQLTRMMALELGPRGIRVNAVNPTVVMTDMGRLAWSDPAKAGPVLGRTAQGKFAEPEHVARVVAFLLGPDSDMVDGACVPVDGGFLVS